MSSESKYLVPNNLKYNEAVADKVVAAAAEGCHIPGQMLAAGIRSKDTWYRWQKEYPEFRAAVEFAKLVSQDWWERLGVQAVKGEIPNFNATTYALVVNNKFGDEYKRSSSGQGNTEINVTTINYTTEQLKQRIAQKWQKLKSVGWEMTDQGEIVDGEILVDD